MKFIALIFLLIPVILLKIMDNLIDSIEKCFTRGELRKLLAQTILDVRYAGAYVGEAWWVTYPNPVERNHYMELAEASRNQNSRHLLKQFRRSETNFFR